MLDQNVIPFEISSDFVIFSNAPFTEEKSLSFAVDLLNAIMNHD